MVAALGEGSKDYLAQGITTNADAGVGLFLGESELEAHLIAAQKVSINAFTINDYTHTSTRGREVW